MLLAVSDREKQLQRDQADLGDARDRLQREHSALLQERSQLEAAAAEISNRVADLDRRERALESTEAAWDDRVQQLETKQKVSIKAALHMLSSMLCTARQHLTCLAFASCFAGGQRSSSEGSQGATCTGDPGAAPEREGSLSDRAQVQPDCKAC